MGTPDIFPLRNNPAQMGLPPNLTGGIRRTALDKFRDFVSIKDFGVNPNRDDNTQYIQDALDSGASDIYFPDDVVYQTTKLTLNADVRLYGRSTLKLADGQNTQLITNTKSDANIFIEGLTLDGNCDNQTTFINTLDFQTVDTLVVTRSNILNTIKGGLAVQDFTSDVEVSHCLFQGGKEHSGAQNDNTIYISIRGDSNDDEQSVLIAYNKLRGITPSVAGRGVGGIIITNLSDNTEDEGAKCVILGNDIRNCGQYEANNKIGGVTLYRGAPQSVIAFNKILNALEVAIDAHGSDGMRIVSNYIKGFANGGIVAAPRDEVNSPTRTIIHGNVVRGSGLAAGLTLQGAAVSSYNPRDAIISSNHVENVNQFLYIADFEGTVKVCDNVFYKAATTGTSATTAAVSVIGSTEAGTQAVNVDIEFNNNSFEDLKSRIYFSEIAGNIKFSGNKVRGNTATMTCYVGNSSSASCDFGGNSFDTCLQAIRVDNAAVIDIKANQFRNISAAGAVSIRDTVSTSLTAVNNNSFLNCAGNVVIYNNADGRHTCRDNIGPAGTTISVGTSTVDQDNYFS
jgi:hypothetical protein